MKHIYTLLGIAFILAPSCSQNITLENTVESVLINVEELDSEDATKATIAIESSKPVFYWSDTDEVGIFPNQGGYQLGFSLAGQGGKKTATFNGGGWALRSDAAYSTYYPFRFENRNPERIPVSYLNQKQTGDSNLSHIGPYYYCATEPTIAENGVVSFSLKNVGALVWFYLTVPDAATYTEISLVTDANLFTTAGTYDLKNFDLSVTPTKTDKRISLALDNVTTTSSNQIISAYMMAAPFDLTGHAYKVYVKTNAGIYYSADLSDKTHTLERNQSRRIAATVEMSDGYNMGIGDWGNGGNIGGDAN